MQRSMNVLAVLVLLVSICTPVLAQLNSGGPVGGTQAVINLGADPTSSTFKPGSVIVHVYEPAGKHAECQSCIINQFARSVPQDQMTSCNGL